MKNLRYSLGLMDSKGTWTLAKEISGAFMGLPCCWNDAGWKRGLPEPAAQLLGKEIGGAPGAVAGSPAGAINGAEVTVVGIVTPGNTEGVAMPWVAVLEEKQKKKWETQLKVEQAFHCKPKITADHKDKAVARSYEESGGGRLRHYFSKSRRKQSPTLAKMGKAKMGKGLCTLAARSTLHRALVSGKSTAVVLYIAVPAFPSQRWDPCISL